MYKHIYVPVDNSDYSNRAIELAVELGTALGARLTGSHVYAARLHDYRFKQMEYTLPEEYKDENELERQRKIHDSLIAMGLQLISESYLDVMKAKAEAAGLAFTPKMMDGKHYKALIEDTLASDYDLVIMGALGMGAVKDSQLGSVTERFVRHVGRDTLIVRNHDRLKDAQGAIVVCLDGSPQSFHGLKVGLALSRALGRPVQAIGVYDPYLHYAMFNGIVGVLSEKASKIFRFKEQEQLHEEIIDTGLAKIYQSHLEIGRKLAAEDGVDLSITLLDGKCFEKILTFARKEQPWLLIMGRVGVHSDEHETDLGSNTENLMRLAPCNVLLTGGKFYPPLDVKAEEIISWTEEAETRMERVPPQVKGVARTALLRYAIEQGHTVITNKVIDEAMAIFMPTRMAEAPCRQPAGHRHLLGVRLHRQGPQRGGDLSRLQGGTREVPGHLAGRGGSHRLAGGRHRGGGVDAGRTGEVVRRRARRPARGRRRLPPPPRQGAGREVRPLAEDPRHHLPARAADDRGDRRPRQARRRLGHPAGQDPVRAGRGAGGGAGRGGEPVHVDGGGHGAPEPGAGRLHARHDARGDREGGRGPGDHHHRSGRVRGGDRARARDDERGHLRVHLPEEAPVGIVAPAAWREGAGSGDHRPPGAYSRG
jgi:nucleotide-binding universal stress UspA family protein